MTEPRPHTYTSFDGHRRIASGSLVENALAVKQALDRPSAEPVLIFDDEMGRSIDIDKRGTEADIAARFAAVPAERASAGQDDAPTTQPGGASVALRKLIEEARRAGSEKDRLRQAHERAYHFMQAIAGDPPGFEEATRALFAHEPAPLRDLLAAWPSDVRDHAMRLAFGKEISA